MDATSVLTKEVENNKAINNDGNERDMNDMVESASRVIAPLGPISKFAARNPWMGLENQPFQQVADWLKATRDVDIYPSANLILAAKNNGEIDEAFVKEGLKRWLDSNSFHIPQDVKERFCHAALKLDTLPSELLTSQKLEKLAKNLNGRNTGSAENVPLQPISSQLENQDGERLETILDHHVIKWCKLFLDISQAGWTMPHREKGFYGAWRQLIQYDSALSKSERKSLKDWPQEASMALQHVLSLLEIPKEKIQSYLEGHLLSLPGWAGMMLWRSRQSNDEQTLLTEYLAVRISMEYALLKPYLPLSIQHEKKASITTLIAAWIHWGDLTMEEWSTMSALEQAEYLSFAYEFNDHVRRKIWLEAWEQTYTDRLSQMIRSTQRKINDRKSALGSISILY